MVIFMGYLSFREGIYRVELIDSALRNGHVVYIVFRCVFFSVGFKMRKEATNPHKSTESSSGRWLVNSSILSFYSSENHNIYIYNC